MDFTVDTRSWERLKKKKKTHQLFLRQKALLDCFLTHGAISREQHDRSLRDLTEKMGETA